VAGAAEEAAARIHAMLDEQRTRLDARWRPAHHGQADVLLIDAESVYGHMDWLRAQASGRLVVAMTASQESYDPDFWLRTPLQAADLVAVLNRIGAQLGVKAAPQVTPIRTPAAAPVAAASAVTAPPPAKVAVEAARTAPQESPTRPPPQAVAAAPAPTPQQPRTLLELIEREGEGSPLAQRLRLQAEGLPEILLDPRERTWHSSSSLKGLSGWATRALHADDARHISDADFASASASLASQPLARLKWLVHLVRGDGQLDPSLDPGARYKLTRWPQSEREFPKHFRIATMMLKSAAPLEEIAELSGASVADVANFINAYHALGFIEPEVAERGQDDGRRSGLFGRMKKTSAVS
jgi:hypothetical protein